MVFYVINSCEKMSDNINSTYLKSSNMRAMKIVGRICEHINNNCFMHFYDSRQKHHRDYLAVQNENSRVDPVISDKNIIRYI